MRTSGFLALLPAFGTHHLLLGYHIQLQYDSFCSVLLYLLLLCLVKFSVFQMLGSKRNISQNSLIKGSV